MAEPRLLEKLYVSRNRIGPCEVPPPCNLRSLRIGGWSRNQVAQSYYRGCKKPRYQVRERVTTVITKSEKRADCSSIFDADEQIAGRLEHLSAFTQKM